MIQMPQSCPVFKTLTNTKEEPMTTPQQKGLRLTGYLFILIATCAGISLLSDWPVVAAVAAGLGSVIGFMAGYAVHKTESEK